MPSYDNLDDDIFSPSSSRFLAPNPLRKLPSKQSINGRRSTASLRGTSLAQTLDDDAANGRHSLAHELAVALMPEPSAGQKLLAEEFGIEYDEGAEGIDEIPEQEQSPIHNGHEITPDSFGVPDPHSPLSFTVDAPPDFDPAFGSPSASPKQSRMPEQDPMVILAEDLEFTEKFLSQLRRLDGDSSATASNLEKVASDMIRRIDDTARDREGQVRELLEYEREFRRIAGEIGGNDVLGQLDELEDLIDEPPQDTSSTVHNPDLRTRVLDSIHEESLSNSQLAGSGSDWEAYLDRDRERLGEATDDEYDSSVYSPSPVKTTFAAPPPITGPLTPAATIPHLTHLRTFTASVASSLAIISEQTQVNAAATTEAGRKIRALKNKLGGWRTEWDSAERSRVRIEKWEAGIVDIDGSASPIPGTPSKLGNARRIDGRKLVSEHLQAFERALLEANIKTQAIMTAVAV